MSSTRIVLLALMLALALGLVLASQLSNQPGGSGGKAGDGGAGRADRTSAETGEDMVPLPTDPKIKVRRVKPKSRGEIEPGQATVLYPDGSVLPTLNGVTETLDRPIKWPANRPYSPVIGIWNDGTKDFYIHRDGTRSTTFYPDEVIRNGKPTREAIALVQSAAPALPNNKVMKAKGKSKLPVEK